jgi:prophage regulatory protein
MNDAVLRMNGVKEKVGRLSKSWIYGEIAKGRFPRPIKIGERAVGWLESEIDGWLSDRIEQSRPTEKGPAAPSLPETTPCSPQRIKTRALGMGLSARRAT